MSRIHDAYILGLTGASGSVDGYVTVNSAQLIRRSVASS